VKSQLMRAARSRSVSVRFAQRAQIVLLAAGGMQDIDIARKMKITRQRCARWRLRFIRSGIDALKQDAPRPGRKKTFSEDTVKSIVRKTLEEKPENADEVWTYVVERLRSSYLEGESGRAVTTEMFDAVLASRTQSVLDIDLRLRALEPFLKMSEAESLAAANKRIANILRKAPDDVTGAVDTSRLQDGPERQLFEHVLSMERAVNPLFARREYTQALTQLATLRDDVDRFFDSVMVMAEDAEVRANRLGLLLRLRALFLQFADLSRLPG
jgi:glycyl-tRNA synthetase beta subunit